MKATDCVSRETQDRLDAYVNLLTRWNKHIRLTSLSFSDGPDNPIDASMALAALLDIEPSSALDIGSGNGLPALPLSIAFGFPYVLVEADQRKAAFLREVIREVGCPAHVEARRIEDTPVEAFDLITARAFGSLSSLMAIAHPRQKPGTTCLFPKGVNIDGELADASAEWSFTAVCHPATRGQVVEIRSIIAKR